MRYVINDIDRDVSALEAFSITILDPARMTSTIKNWEGWNSLPTTTTLVLFPGNGAQDVRHHLGEEFLAGWRTAAPAASRFWYPEAGDPGAVVESPTQFELNITDIVVIDDVISSGATVLRTKERWSPFLPRAKWHAVTWIAQCATTLRGFTSKFAAVEVGERNRKVPINSLSTFVTNPEVAQSYAERNFQNPTAFLAALEELR